MNPEIILMSDWQTSIEQPGMIAVRGSILDSRPFRVPDSANKIFSASGPVNRSCCETIVGGSVHGRRGLTFETLISYETPRCTTRPFERSEKLTVIGVSTLSMAIPLAEPYRLMMTIHDYGVR